MLFLLYSVTVFFCWSITRKLLFGVVSLKHTCTPKRRKSLILPIVDESPADRGLLCLVGVGPDCKRCKAQRKDHWNPVVNGLRINGEGYCRRGNDSHVQIVSHLPQANLLVQPG